MSYADKEIKDSILEFLGEEGIRYFRDLIEEYGTPWIVQHIDGIYVHNWTTVGRHIKNYIRSKFPDLIKEFDNYASFEDYICGIVEDLFE